MADLIAGNAPQWIPLDNRIGCVPASEITPSFTPFDWVADQTYGREMVNDYWRPIAGYDDWQLDDRLEVGSQLYIHTAQDIAEMVPHYDHDGAGGDGDAAWYQLSVAPSGSGLLTSWVCFEGEALTLFYRPSLLDGVLQGSTGFRLQPTWTDYTGNGLEFIWAYFLLETSNHEIAIDMYYEYYDVDEVLVFTATADNYSAPPTFDPDQMRYFRLRHSVAANTFYYEWAQTKGGPWYELLSLALPQVVPLWGFGIDWVNEIAWGTYPDTTRPSSSFFSFNPQAGAFQAALPLDVSVGDVPIPGGTDIQVDLTNEVGEM